MKKRNIVVVGGGTAGWLTALFMKKIFDKDANITLIESEDIGVLGAGEGSTPNFPGILNFLGINFRDFVVKTNATHKLGISFENWNGDGKNYYHPFGTYELKYDWMSDANVDMIPKYIGYLNKNNLDYQKHILSNRLSDSNLSPLLRELNNGMENSVNYGFHFDANLVAKFLRKTAERRKITRIEGVVKKFVLDEKENIKKIVLKDNTMISSDFVFDCSGFNRLIIGKLYKTNWIPYGNSLKVSAAMTFQLPQSQNEIYPYTKAIAMKYGWMWMIPLQNRIGCGYNFDESFIGIDEAKKEVEEFFGHTIEISNVIQYNAGRFDKLWVGNCVAVGLSAGFTEPIEATSIFTSINQLFSMSVETIEKCILGDKEPANFYNENAAKFNDLTKDFLQYHYFTKRQDTEFWKTYYDTTYKSENLIKKMSKWNNTIPVQLDFDKEPFTLYNWLHVGLGLGLFDKKTFENNLSKNELDKIEKWHIEQEEYNNKLYNLSIDEKECIEIIKSFYYG
jgi:tryptophan halogenase